MSNIKNSSKKKNGIANFFNKTISRKLYTILTIVSLVVFIIVLVANFTSSTLTMVTSFARMERVHSVALSNAKASFYEFLIFNEPSILNDYQQSIEKAASYSHTFGKIEILIKDTPHKDAVSTFNKVFTEVDQRESEIIINRVGLLLWNPIVQKLINIAYETNKLTEQYKKLISDYTQETNEEGKEAILASINNLETQLDDLPRQFSDTTGELSDFASNVVNVALWSLFVLLVIICVVLIVPINRSITNSIKKVSNILADLAQGDGDLTVELPINSDDEIGELSKNFNVFINKLRNVIRQVVENVEVQVKTSVHINEASNKLNSLSTKQAASIEEFAASMEEVKSSIEQNASNAIKTSDTAKKVSQKAIGGGEKVAETAKNMIEITSLIKIVEEIAFKTNLLALNASVEAAHAGLHGKGFAVVAGEVKKLAEQTKIAAHDIGLMLKNSTEASNQAGIIVGEIVPEIKETAGLIEEISNATEEQNSNISELNNSINILNQISTESADLAHQLVETFNNLDERTHHLKTTMGFFKID